MLLNQKSGKSNRPPGAGVRPIDRRLQRELSGRREAVLDPGLGLDFEVRFGTMRATGAAGLGAGAERLIDDGLDGAGAATAFGVAAKTAIDLLRAARKVRRSSHGIADIMVTQDVAGTNDHEVGRPLGDAF